MNDAEKKDLRKYPGGGGGKTPYISHIGMCRHRRTGNFLPGGGGGGKPFAQKHLAS